MTLKNLLWAILVVSILGSAPALVLVHSPNISIGETARLRADLERLRARNHEIRRQNERLKRLVEALDRNPDVLEKVAREDLGFIKDGEVVILLPE